MLEEKASPLIGVVPLTPEKNDLPGGGRPGGGGPLHGFGFGIEGELPDSDVPERHGSVVPLEHEEEEKLPAVSGSSGRLLVAPEPAPEEPADDGGRMVTVQTKDGPVEMPLGELRAESVFKLSGYARAAGHTVSRTMRKADLLALVAGEADDA